MAACNALGEGYDIRNHSARKILTLECEPGSGAPDACLDLIDDEQRIVVVAHLTGLLHVVGTKRAHAGLTLNQLHDDGGDRTLAIFAGTGFGKRVMQCGIVTSFDKFDIGNQRIEGFHVADSAPMVRPWKPWVMAMIRAGFPPMAGDAPGKVRPYSLASFNAASLPSAPELPKYT